MKIITGNIFTTKCQTIVNTVNCFGVMGAGLALECRYRYPEMFIRYKEMCDKNLLDIGKLYLYKTQEKWILNFPTKHHWKYDSKKEFIEKGLRKFVQSYRSKEIESIAFPLLGAQNGGVSNEESFSLLEKYLSDIQIPVEIYQYDPESRDDLFHNFKEAFLTHSESTLVKSTHIKRVKIDLLKSILENENLKSMNQLMSCKGVGESTLEKCYSYAMRPDVLNV